MLKDRFKLMKEDFGVRPICNRKKHRGIHIGKFCLPLCARCTGLIVGYAIGLATKLSISTMLGLLCLTPTGIDGIMQYGFGFESTNPRRFITGFMGGFGLGIVD